MKHNCFDITYGTKRQALLKGTQPGKINEVKYCKSCKRWYIEIK
jgi:hypothetical protein